MKKQILLHSFMFLVLISNAQSGKFVKQPGHFGAALSAIVLDFKNNFLVIQGNELAGSSATNTYASAICLPEALHCAIVPKKTNLQAGKPCFLIAKATRMQ